MKRNYGIIIIIIIQITYNFYPYQLYTRFCSLKHIKLPHTYIISSIYPIKISNPCQFFNEYPPNTTNIWYVVPKKYNFSSYSLT